METNDWYAFGMIVTFVVGYLFITFESITHVNKTTIALLMAVICWILQFLDPTLPLQHKTDFLGEHLNNISQVIFFLLGALAIVEIINVHQGFNIISNAITYTSKRKLLWIFGIMSFFLSAVLDNLTTTVVMISLLRKIVDDGDDRLIIGGGIVIAANAGGAWTPIGDVTTTMLWIGGQVSTISIMKALLLPSLICIFISLAILSFMLKGSFDKKDLHFEGPQEEPMGRFIFFLGIFALIMVPVIRIVTGLPPFMGMLLGLSLMWLITDIVHHKYLDRSHLRVTQILPRIDMAGTLFFLGILLCIDALDTAGILKKLAAGLDANIPNPTLIATLIGVSSAVVDNVPLVAATMGMYDLTQYPVDHTFWQLVAYCAGTGGSILLIGSAAGVVFMGLEKVDFLWYLKRISFAAMIGYFAGIGIYLLLM